MERQFNLVLDVNLELELIQVDFDGVLDLLDHHQVPDSKQKRKNLKFWGQLKNIDRLNRQLHQQKLFYHKRFFNGSRKLNREDSPR